MCVWMMNYVCTSAFKSGVLELGDCRLEELRVHVWDRLYTWRRRKWPCVRGVCARGCERARGLRARASVRPPARRGSP
jgi:hypothetical protein